MKILSWNINGLISFVESQSYLEIKNRRRCNLFSRNADEKKFEIFVRLFLLFFSVQKKRFAWNIDFDEKRAAEHNLRTWRKRN